MSVETLSERTRGVVCRYCGKPVRVPKIVREKSDSHAPQAVEGEAHYQLVSRVFVLRCRSCERESVYAMNQIVDIPAVPAREAERAAAAAG